MAYAVRQWIALLANPLIVALCLALAGTFLVALRRRRLGRALFAAATVLAYVGSTAAVGDLLIGPLERRYPPLAEGAIPVAVKYVVVLGSGFAPHGNIPITAAIDPDGLPRIVEAVRLIRRLPDARLVVSGGARAGALAPALGYAQLARDLGVVQASMVVLDKGLNTHDEARNVAGVLGNERFLLVTSAYQMPRAMRLMEQYRLMPIPAPTGQSAHWLWDWHVLLPSPGGLRNCERALHEYLGFAALILHLE